MADMYKEMRERKSKKRLKNIARHVHGENTSNTVQTKFELPGMAAQTKSKPTEYFTPSHHRRSRRKKYSNYSTSPPRVVDQSMIIQDQILRNDDVLVPHDNQNVPEVDEQEVNIPSINEQEAIPSINVNIPSIIPSINAIPSTNVNEATPSINVNEATPSINVNIPSTNVNEATPSINVNEQEPSINVTEQEATPSINVSINEAIPSINVNELDVVDPVVYIGNNSEQQSLYLVSPSYAMPNDSIYDFMNRAGCVDYYEKIYTERIDMETLYIMFERNDIVDRLKEINITLDDRINITNQLTNQRLGYLRVS